MSGFMVGLSSFREQYIKSFEYPAIIFLLIVVILSLLAHENRKHNYFLVNSKLLLIVYGLIIAGLTFIYLKPDVNSYVLPDRMTLDTNHFMITVIALIVGIFAWLQMRKDNLSSSLLGKFQALFLILSVISGLFMMIKFEFIYQIVRIAYTVFDLAIVLSVLTSIIYLINDQFSKYEQAVQK